MQATALNVANMVGIGPFITIPLFLSAMGGPQALVGWVVAAVLVLCDGLVWSELGAALPGSGGSYHFLSETFGRYRWGRIVPFLFIWQFLVSGTLEMASGYIGAMDYLEYALPRLDETLAAWHVPAGKSTIAACAALLMTLALCRSIRSLGWFGVVLGAGTLITVVTVIVAGLTHFNPALLTFPENAFRLDGTFLYGLGGSMLIAIYDYLGYYNVCHLGDEVVDPGKTIPRAVLLSVVIVATLYLTMNVAIIGVVPWQQAMQSHNIAAEFMETLFGRPIAVAFTWLILWTVAACMFAITLGYSRIPYAAARNGDFFRVFSTVHAEQRYPIVSLWALGLLTAAFCYFPLQSVIEAGVTVRIVVEFMGQIAALHLLRTKRPDVAMPFRMWLYPLPSLVALCGWSFVLATSSPHTLAAAFGTLLSGLAVYGLIQWLGVSRPERRGPNETAFRALISQERFGPIDAGIIGVLRITSLIYAAGVWLRNFGFDRGWCRIEQAALPVVSIGNLTTGGTGKTPFAAFVAQWFRQQGVRVCFLSRGYRAHAAGMNDEALVLERHCPDVPHLQNPDRAASARIAREELDSQLLILDDGFQHRRLARDLDIVLIDAVEPWGLGYLLPRGLLREPVSSLRRAQLAVVTRVDQVLPEAVAAIRERLLRAAPQIEIVEAAFPPRYLVSSQGATLPLDTLRGRSVAAFSGLGNPEGFEQSLERLGYRVVASRRFSDHHLYTRDDIESLQHWATEVGAEAVITTEKDLVKIMLENLSHVPLWGVQISTEVVQGREFLDSLLGSLLRQTKRDAS